MATLSFTIKEAWSLCLLLLERGGVNSVHILFSEGGMDFVLSTVNKGGVA